MLDPKTDPVLYEFIELVSEVVRDFVPHREFPAFRVPRHPVALDPICDHVGLDAGNDPYSLSRTLFMLEWDSFPGYSSFWHLHALRLPSAERAYWVDGVNGRRIIAVGPGGVGADGRFARALFASNGEVFGIGIVDSAPSRVCTSLRGELLIDLFLAAFDGSANGWNALDGVGRGAVRRWLKETLTKGGKELRDPKRLTNEEAQREFLTLIEGIVSDFTPLPEEAKVGVPRRFTSLFPLAKSLRKPVHALASSLSYRLFQFAWWSVPGSTCIQQISAILLPDHTRVFWFYLEAGDDDEQRHFIAGTAAPNVSDLRFLQLLFAGNGKAFGVEVCGCAPSEIITPLTDDPQLVDLFVSAYNGFPQAWDSLDDYQPEGRVLDFKDPAHARELVERHLRAVTHRPHRPEIG
jgi:hypothetical protein